MAKTQFTEKHHHVSPRRLLGLVVALIVLFLLLTSVINIMQKYFTTRRHIRELTEERQELQQKQKALAKTNAYLATPDGTEQALREKYNVVKPGEGIVLIVDAEATKTPPETSRVTRWWHAILEGLGIRKRP